MPTNPPSYRLCGFKITPTTVDDLFSLIGRAVRNDRKVVIASQNVHGLYVYARDETFRRLHEDPDTCVHIDGMPLVWLGRAFGLDLKAEHRTGWIDWFLPLLERADREGWRIFYLGAPPDVLETGLATLRRRFPGLQIEGRDGYFDTTRDGPENRAVVERINACRPHMLIVGMGMGRQEHWIAENKADLAVNCIGTCGACLEYFAGAAYTPPRWLGRFGLEWTARLLANPKRFWRRYLVEPWYVAWWLSRGVAARRPAVERIEA
ncbi:WecB/TagA/CpsF family glycosyltransferase [Arenibaculum sp.]|jgi:N-acetylglucosaminyldiphosphoundecaprenol N-acetyl-beta-D-mannosaminyltransferase|uniref:WecB/TagA/CpsF family glycosyltransferase n=1 Tax=Arenibaculum sp. TaxID=2865862 RepID=UPI002E0F6C0E|nr:WecB/TagA/CpsF family glycosyltransferase [Arenibaculum sp.]